jgi:hypothetical protein
LTFSSHQPGCPPPFLFYFFQPELPLLLPFNSATFSSSQPRSREFASLLDTTPTTKIISQVTLSLLQLPVPAANLLQCWPEPLGALGALGSDKFAWSDRFDIYNLLSV